MRLFLYTQHILFYHTGVILKGMARKSLDLFKYFVNIEGQVTFVPASVLILSTPNYIIWLLFIVMIIYLVI
jgi:hypothetical protein